jgi:hypothetical protein
MTILFSTIGKSKIERPCGRAARPSHWHVRIRTNVIVCRGCGARIPKWQNPQFCPECGAGREAAGALS